MPYSAGVIVLEQLRAAVTTGELRSLDMHFADYMAELAGGQAPELLLAAALVSRQAGQGHTCLPLERWAETPVLGGSVITPSLAVWRTALLASSMVTTPGGRAPLVLDNDRLYLLRYWRDETTVADRLRQLAQLSTTVTVDESVLVDGLQRLFGSNKRAIDWQKIAATIACLQRLTVISGGPGTGKTTTVVRLLALLFELHQASQPTRPLRIALAAPTGKAATRLGEAIKHQKANLNCAESVLAAIPEQPITLHRLLAIRPNLGDWAHQYSPQLAADVVVVDEASMVDLPLMARLLRALAPQTRLILLGDKDQLASVEAGAVLGDICAGFNGYPPALAEQLSRLTGQTVPAQSAPASDDALSGSICLLHHGYRFTGDSGIGRLALAVNQGDVTTAQSLCTSHSPDLIWRDLVRPEQMPALLSQSAAHFAQYLKVEDPASALAALIHYRVLCALREGPYGVVEVNRGIEMALQRSGLISRDNRASRLYRGQPILITRNDYGSKLFNGDMGVIWPDPVSGRLMAWFANPEGGVRALPTPLLPRFETAYALTVHKSQGSEFHQIALVLPAESVPLVTRELVYTGLTRARETVELWAHWPSFATAISRSVERDTGLAGRLW